MLSLLIKCCCRHVSANERFRGPLIRSLVFTRPVDVNARLAGYRRCRQDEPPTRLYRTTGQRPSTTDPRSSQAELPGLVSGPAGGCEPGLWSDEAGSGFNARLPQTTVEHRPDQTGSLVPRQSLGTSWSTTVQVVSLLLPRPATACNVVYCLGICSVMTYKTITQMSVRLSVRPSGVNIFKTITLRDHWTDVDETRHVYFTGLGTQLLGSGIFNFGPCAARGHPELNPVGSDDHPERGAYCNILSLAVINWRITLHYITFLT